MIGRLKTLLVVPLAALAACGALAPSASAGFESEAKSTTLSVSSNSMQSFKLSAGSESTIECTTLSIDNATLEGEATSTAEVEPTLSSCEEFLGLAVQVHVNGCKYLYDLATNDTEGSFHIECPSETGMEITIGSTCRYEIDSQTNLGTVKYKNIGSSTTREIEQQHSVTGITSVRTKSTFPFNCPNASSSGTYTGNDTYGGSSLSGHVGIFVK